MFWESFKVTGSAVGQIFLLGAIGYILVRKNLLGSAGLDALSRLVIEITLPLLIFCQLLRDFSFRLYPDWWVLPLLSIAITGVGLGLGFIFSFFIRGQQHKLQFVSLVGFQNSGYLPLGLVGTLLTPDKVDTMFIYLFLFLAGFNLAIFSVGSHIISYHKDRKFELRNLFSPPVVAVIAGLFLVFFGAHNFIPPAVLKPLRLVGDCTMPLAMFVVGGNLAQIRLTKIDRIPVLLMSLAKLIILPALGLLIVLKLQLPQLLGLLIIIQLAMPPATFLSVITRHYKKEDLLISQGILLGHIISIFTIPLFLTLYFMLAQMP